jgi:hypothetical protein
MLEIAIVGLVIGAAYAVYLAPSEQKLTIALVLVALTAIGFGVGFAITKPGTYERTFYPIAAAIGGAMIAFGWISRKQKTWPKKEKQ